MPDSSSSEVHTSNALSYVSDCVFGRSHTHVYRFGYVSKCERSPTRVYIIKWDACDYVIAVCIRTSLGFRGMG